MTGLEAGRIRAQARFRGISPGGAGKGGRGGKEMLCLSKGVYRGCGEYVAIAEEKMSNACLDGSQIRRLEEELAGFLELGHAVAVRSGEDALRLALRLAAWKLYGHGGSSCWPDCHQGTGIQMPDLPGCGILRGQKVLCQDLAAMDLAGTVLTMGGEPVLIDSSESGWAMSPEVLELAFRACPDAKIAIMDHVYGFPGDAPAVRKICDRHNALLVECAGDALGAGYWVPQGDVSGAWAKAGTLGDFCVLSFGSGKVLGTPGGALLVRDSREAEIARHWAGGAKGFAPHGQIGEPGCRYNYVLSDADAAMLRSQLSHISEMIRRKREIYQKYYDSLDGDLAFLIPEGDGTRPNYWASCMTSESAIQFMKAREVGRGCTYQDIHGTAAPMEICEALHAFGAECRAVYKPLSMQPAYRGSNHFTLDGAWGQCESYGNNAPFLRSRAWEYFESGVILPSDISMTDDEQDRVIDIIYACYDKSDINRRTPIPQPCWENWVGSSEEDDSKK